MKRYYFVSILFAAALAVLGCAGMEKKAEKRAISLSDTELADGVYEGSARGYRGVISVRLRIEQGSMAEIDIVDSPDDRFVGAAAMEELLELALIYNTVDLDAVSGATESCQGFLAALANALEQARR